MVVRKTKRPKGGRVTKREKRVVEEVVRSQIDQNMSLPQVKALAITLDRSTATTKRLIEEARANLHQKAQFYVDSHLQAVQNALANIDTDARYADAAIKGSQWALERINEGGARIIDKDQTSGTSNLPRLAVAIAIGGVDMTAVASDPTTITVDACHPDPAK